MTRSRSFAALRATAWIHPRRATLTAFALGDLEHRGRVARHLETCSDCRQFVGFTQRLTISLDAPIAAAPEALLERALADRSMGARVILPSAEPAMQAVAGRRLQVAGLIIAAATIAVLAYQRPKGGEFTSGNELLLAGFVPKTAEAGQGGRADGPLTHYLRPLAVTYQRRFVDTVTGSIAPKGEFDVRVTQAALGKWLVTSAWRDIAGNPDMQGARSWVESVTVADTALAPVTRVAHVMPYRKWAGIYINQRFRNDSVVGQMSLDEDPTRRPIARSLRGERDRLIAADPLAPLYFMGVPILPGSEFDVAILGWAVVPTDFLVRMRMKVAGSERIGTPAGTFDCWKFVISVGGETHYHWVRKSDHLAVLTRRWMGDGRMRELILVAEGR
jgi:hypothetical protein